MLSLVGFLSFLLIFANGQQDNDCDTKQNCNECIQQLGCVWCINPISTSGTAPTHCLNSKNLKANCRDLDLIKIASSLTVLKDNPLSGKSGQVTQLKPQKIAIKLRKNEEYTFKFSYRQAEDYPVDVYYLMDLSASMKESKKILSRLGKRISETMLKLTKDFRLGFGSFVDKNTLPYALVKKAASSSMVPPYSFINHMPLTDNWQLFNKEVENAKLSENLDSPEGGLDAIMQSIVCKKEIQWRDNARHLLLFSTDATSHIAGDGKLAGIVEPNDGKCHLNNHIYTDFAKYDYPSISQINHVARKNNINIIFALKSKLENSKTHYRKMSSLVENSKFVVLEDNPDRVVNIIEESYKAIVNSVVMTSDAPKTIDLKFNPNCSSPVENGCTQVHVGEILEFEATIKATHCTKDNKYTISVKPQSLAEVLTIDLEVECDCGCSALPSFQPKAPQCSNQGNLECGICSCDDGFSGEKCECNGASVDTSNVTMCINPTSMDVCSDSGICKCGTCQCNKRSKNQLIYGKYCQCTNYGCERNQGKLCSDNGDCDCGTCKCNPGWNGAACDCQTSNRTCIRPGTDEVCSGRGSCSCGKCDCVKDHNRYDGNYCEECSTCMSQLCSELEPCVQCKVFETGHYNKSECALRCNHLDIEIVQDLNTNIEEHHKDCTLLDKEGCRSTYKYSYDNGRLAIKASKKRICPAPPNIFAWVGAVVGTIIVAGLIMLIMWKVCTTLHDKKEYAKFEEERRKMMWGRENNPLYKDPSNTFKNPAYGRRSMRLSS